MDNQDIIDEEKALGKRLIVKEKEIKILTSKYLELIKKFNGLARNEMKSMLDEISNQIDIIEINVLKANNIKNLKEKEKNMYLEEKNKINNDINFVKDEMVKKKKELYEVKKHREYLIKCEDIAKQINKYEIPKIINEQIREFKDENTNILKNKEEIDEKLKNDEDKINKILNLVSELKNNYPPNNDSTNIVNNTNN